MRKQLVETLVAKGIQNEAVLEAMRVLPRHFFIDRGFEEWAYQDKAFPIGQDQTISQPYTVAYMTALLEVQAREKVLEIGTGSGYQAAVLGLLGARVYTVERQEALYLKAKNLLKALNFNLIRCFFRDGTEGLPEFAPYDKIIVTAGAAELPQALLAQLAVGGRLVIPMGQGDDQKMYRVTKLSETDFEQEILGEARFVPFLSGLNRYK